MFWPQLFWKSFFWDKNFWTLTFLKKKNTTTTTTTLMGFDTIESDKLLWEKKRVTYVMLFCFWIDIKIKSLIETTNKTKLFPYYTHDKTSYDLE